VGAGVEAGLAAFLARTISYPVSRFATGIGETPGVHLVPKTFDLPEDIELAEQAARSLAYRYPPPAARDACAPRRYAYWEDFATK